MADTLQFELVSPERSLASLEVTEVQIPGSEGDMTAMADHAPVITTLRPGVLAATGANGTEEFVVTGGFAEISSKGVTVLAEQAIAKSSIDQDQLSALVASASSAAEGATGDAADAAAKSLADYATLGEQLGLNGRG